jgi:hypothetical protein
MTEVDHGGLYPPDLPSCIFSRYFDQSSVSLILSFAQMISSDMEVPLGKNSTTPAAMTLSMTL